MNNTPERLAPHERLFGSIGDPKTVVIIGATDRPNDPKVSPKLGSILKQQLEAFRKRGGEVFLINPTKSEIDGQPCYASIDDIPATTIDVALVATPYKTVPALIDQFKGRVKTAIVYGANMAQDPEEKKSLRARVRAAAEKDGVLIIGSNTAGVNVPGKKFQAHFMGKKGQEYQDGPNGCVLQSGGMGIELGSMENGFSTMYTIGDADGTLGVADYLYALADDPKTKRILVYLEGPGDNVQALLDAIQVISARIPIFILNAVQNDETAKAAASHTGAVTGSPQVLNELLRKCGAVLVSDLDDLSAVGSLDRGVNLSGNRIAIVTNVGGPSNLAMNAITGSSLQLRGFEESIVKELRTVLVDPSKAGNKVVDLIGTANPDQIYDGLRVAIQSKEVDIIYLKLSETWTVNLKEAAEKIASLQPFHGKTVVCHLTAGNKDAEEILRRAGVSVFDSLTGAVRALDYQWLHQLSVLERANRRHPSGSNDVTPEVNNQISRAMTDVALREGRTALTEQEAQALFRNYGVPFLNSIFAKNEDDAVRAYQTLVQDHPCGEVCVKLVSSHFTHKTEVGGVQKATSEDEVRVMYQAIQANAQSAAVDEMNKKGTTIDAEQVFSGVMLTPWIEKTKTQEIILGAKREQFTGAISVTVGAGGIHQSAYNDIVMGIPPFDTDALIQQTRIGTILRGHRDQPAYDCRAIDRALRSLVKVLEGNPRLETVEVNPLCVSQGNGGAVALDSLATLFAPGEGPMQCVDLEGRRYADLQQQITLEDGRSFTLRPVNSNDSGAWKEFVQGFSTQDIRERYKGAISKDILTSNRRILERTQVSDLEIPVVVEDRSDSQNPKICAVGRLSRRSFGSDTAEVSMIVANCYKDRGIGTKLLDYLTRTIAPAFGMRRLTAETEYSNRFARMAVSNGFTSEPTKGDREVVRLSREVDAPGAYDENPESRLDDATWGVDE